MAFGYAFLYSLIKKMWNQESFKVHDPISHSGGSIQMMHYHPRNLCFRFHLNRSNRLDVCTDYVYFIIAYILLCRFKYGCHNYSHYFHWHHPSGTFPAVRFTRGIWGKKQLSFGINISEELNCKKMLCHSVSKWCKVICDWSSKYVNSQT